MRNAVSLGEVSRCGPRTAFPSSACKRGESHRRGAAAAWNIVSRRPASRDLQAFRFSIAPPPGAEFLRTPNHGGLAISRDWGHIFQERTRGSTGLGAATDPDVAVAGREVAVTWLVSPTSEAANSDARATRIVRVGRLR